MSKKLIFALVGLALVPVLLWLGAYVLFSSQNLYEMKDPAAKATEVLRMGAGVILMAISIPIFGLSMVEITTAENWKRKP